MALVEWQAIDLREDPDAVRFAGDPADLLDALAELLELVTARPSWHARASCRGQGPDIFFPGRGAPLDAARAICAGCPVKPECLAAALEVGIVRDNGIWGGLSERERKRLRRTSPIGNTAA